MRKSLPLSLATMMALLAVPAVLSAQASDSSQAFDAQQSQPDSNCPDTQTGTDMGCAAAANGGMSSPNYPGLNSSGMYQSGRIGLTGNQTVTNDISPLYGPQSGLAARNAPLPQQPLTEFQKFVASTTGALLPVYGTDLFQRVPATFSPINLAAVTQDYVIGPDDELRIRVWGQINLSENLRVSRTGEVYLPQVGQVTVGGLTYAQLDQHLRAAIGRIYRNFDMSVEMGRIRSIEVYVSGQARRPGAYTVSAVSTLVNAIFSSGGPSSRGSLRHIELKRNGAVVTDFDLYALLIHGDKSKDARLLPGDVIYIPAAGPQVALTGSVGSPAIYEVREGETLGDVLAAAGGTTPLASGGRISIERIDARKSRVAMEVAFDATGLGTKLADGDVLRVIPMVPSYSNTVTLRGNVANPGRFAWKPGMRVSDLIPDTESLLTRNYWWHRAQLGLPGAEFLPLTSPATGDSIPAGNEGAIAPHHAKVGEDGLRAPSATSADGATAQNLDENGAESQSGDRGSRLNNGSLGAQLETSGHGTIAGDGARNAVRLETPEIDWNYAVIERMDPKTLQSRLLSFDLGKLVQQHDASQDLELQAGDVITIFSQSDLRVPIAQQTKYVHLEGEFVHSGVYSVQPGERLRDLVARAGGLSQDAYLYGSEFTRESVRVAQQARLDSFVHDLELQVDRGTLALSANPASTAQDLAGTAAAESSSRQLISQLAAVRATGRVVLGIKPDNKTPDTIPDIALEDGDRFVVPPVPSSVNVVGAVYNPSSFLYGSGRSSYRYLKMAGGPNRSADKGQMYIVRADGSVVGRSNSGGLWGNDFEHLALNPGDTLVVPEKTLRPNGLRGLLDFTQILSQLALGAAAIQVLK